MHHIAIDDGVELAFTHGGKGVFGQSGVKRPFRFTGFFLGRDLVPRVIGLHKISRGHKTPVRVSIQKMPSGG